jgi:Skp family chaperone for outer membrane proteins
MKTLLALALSALVLASAASAGNKKNTAATQAASINVQTSIRHIKLRARAVPPPDYVTPGY